MCYVILRKLLFQFDAEAVHNLTLKTLRLWGKLPLPGRTVKQAPVTVMGLQFPNPVGTAAGFDKNGIAIDGTAKLGFGFLEIGTATPKPQPGNPRPRVFRIPNKQAVINRYDFYNHGVHALVDEIKEAKYQGILGVNIVKNSATPEDKAIEDYLYCFEQVCAVASYVTVNVSCPNTEGLRDALQKEDALSPLLAALKQAQAKYQQSSQRYVPLVLKIAPDLSQEQVKLMATLCKQHQIDGVIATNTTTARDKVAGETNADEKGGLSGAPLTEQSTKVIDQLYAELGEEIPIIASGGVMSGEDAAAKLKAGAKLVQVYTGLIYKGPSLVSNIIEHC